MKGKPGRPTTRPTEMTELAIKLARTQLDECEAETDKVRKDLNGLIRHAVKREKASVTVVSKLSGRSRTYIYLLTEGDK